MILWQGPPGSTPIDDISELKVKGIQTQGELDALEAENIRKAVVKYLGRKPSRRWARFDLSWSKRLHQEMFGDVWEWAGRFRRNFNIGVPWQHIETRLAGLLDDLAFWETNDVDQTDQVVWLHHRAVQIHPFTNGNGRWARLLANVWLKLHGSQPTQWPETAVKGVSTIRDEYLVAIRAADEGDYDALKVLHQRFTPGRPS